MARHIAFLRAVNVGGHIVKMDRLRGLFESFGLADVQTFIQTGNVIFESKAQPPALVRKIEAGLQQALGYPVVTFLRTVADLSRIAGHAPFPADDVAGAWGVYVAFLREAPSADAAQKVMALRSEFDDLHVAGSEIYWLRRTVGIAERPGPPIERVLGGPATVRNVTTVRKIAAKYCGEPVTPPVPSKRPRRT